MSICEKYFWVCWNLYLSNFSVSVIPGSVFRKRLSFFFFFFFFFFIDSSNKNKMFLPHRELLQMFSF